MISELQGLKEKLLKHGIQASAPRIAIADYVFSTRAHPTAEEVRAEVEKKMPSVSLATVYNTLHLFVEKGLLVAVKDPASDKWRYDCNTKPHFHFFDETTGQMVDLDASVLRIQPDFSKLYADFEVNSIEVTVKGTRKKEIITNQPSNERKSLDDN
jgi:Fe2+ or Zn2+ uptake regulation protein